MYWCVWLLLAVAIGVAWSAPSPPIWPPSYTIQGILQLPYAEIQEPFTAYWDAKNNRSRIDYYGKTVITIQRAGTGVPGNMGVSIKVAPMTTETVYNARTCFLINGSSEYQITTQAILPDLSDFTLVGSTTLQGRDCDVWKMKQLIGQKRNIYTMYVERKANVPVRYIMQGYDSLLGSHFDKYYLDYSNYKVKAIPADIFNIPPGNKFFAVGAATKNAWTQLLPEECNKVICEAARSKKNEENA